ncbi:hypothetical protein [Dactylosporangium sp. NPDC050588]|uniref:hypothetical protein n=1 Tax=Dactylosporangium sp. NPDC050588 TaxID=3157211 RepID=UPI0033F1390B
MRRFRWCTAGAALLTCWAALPAPPAVGAPAAALPEGLVWVSRGPGDAGSTLHRVTAGGTVARTPLGYAVNAIGCAGDGTLFALATARAGRKLRAGPHVVRIGGDGRVTDLGAVPGTRRASGYPLADAYGGTVVAAGGGVRLLVGTASSVRSVQVSPGAPRLLPSRPLPSLPYAGDWTVEPSSGDLLTVAARGGRAQLVRLGSRVSFTPLPAVLPGRSAYGGVALHPDGTLTALFNQASGPGAGPGTGHAPGGSALFRIPLSDPSRAVKLADLGSVASSDATACPAPPLPAIAGEPDPVVPSPTPSPAIAEVPAPVVTTAPPAVVAEAPPPVVTTAPPRPQVRKATPAPPASSPRPASLPPPPSTPAHRSNVRPAEPVAVPASASSPVGKRFIPVAAGFMIAAVAMTRLFRRRR